MESSEAGPKKKINLSKILGDMVSTADESQRDNLRLVIKIIQKGGSKSFHSLEQVILQTIKNFKQISKAFCSKLLNAIKLLLTKVKRNFQKVQVRKFFFKCLDYFGFYLCSSNFQIKKLFRELTVFCLKDLPPLSVDQKKNLKVVLNSAQILAFHAHLRNQELGVSVLLELQTVFPIARKLMLKILIESQNSNLKKQIMEKMELGPEMLRLFILLVRDNDPEIGKLVVEKLFAHRVDFLSLDFESRCHILHYALLSRSPFKKARFIDYCLHPFDSASTLSDSGFVGSFQLEPQTPVKKSKVKNLIEKSTRKLQSDRAKSSEHDPRAPEEQARVDDALQGQERGGEAMLGRLIDIVSGLGLSVCFTMQKMNTLLITLIKEIYDRLNLEDLEELLVCLLEVVFAPVNEEPEAFNSELQEVLFLLNTLLEYIQNFNFEEAGDNQIYQRRGKILFSRKGTRLERVGKKLEKYTFDNLLVIVDKKLPPFFKFLEVVRLTLFHENVSLVAKYFTVHLLRFLSPDEISRKKLKNLFNEFVSYLHSKPVSLKVCYQDLRMAIASLTKASEDQSAASVPNSAKYLTSTKIKDLCLHYFSYHNFFDTKIFFYFDLMGET